MDAPHGIPHPKPQVLQHVAGVSGGVVVSLLDHRLQAGKVSASWQMDAAPQAESFLDAARGRDGRA
jgi:hypothetical protein